MSKKEEEQKQKEFLKILDREDSRTIREKYSYKELGGVWLTIPLLYLLIGGIIMSASSRNSTSHPSIK